MNKLVINTANDDLLMVLSVEDKLYFEHNNAKMRHNEAMIPLLDNLLKQAKTDISSVEEFGVVIGPGSFTGIRVGIATIKAFRDTLKAKAKGINNLDFLYELASQQNTEVETVAILGSKNSYFVAKNIDGIIYKYERNLTLEELKSVAGQKPVGMFKADDNLNCFVVEVKPEILLACYEKSEDESLTPVYYQLSQAENEKLKNGTVEVVLATQNDIDEIFEIEKSSISSNTLTKDFISNAVTDYNYYCYVCKFNKKIVGFIITQLTDELSVVSVAVEKNMRNFGIATKLFNQVFELAKIKNANVSLEVSERNITASLLYQKLGFSARRIRKNYYQDGSNAVEMVKVIN